MEVSVKQCVFGAVSWIDDDGMPNSHCAVSRGVGDQVQVIDLSGQPHIYDAEIVDINPNDGPSVTVREMEFDSIDVVDAEELIDADAQFIRKFRAWHEGGEASLPCDPGQADIFE